MVKQGIGPTELHAILEGTGVFHESAALALYDAGVTVSIANPAQVRDFERGPAMRTKTDGVDSFVLARYGALLNPRAWTHLYRNLLPHVERMALFENLGYGSVTLAEKHEFVLRNDKLDEETTHNIQLYVMSSGITNGETADSGSTEPVSGRKFWRLTSSSPTVRR